jgi:mRNA interferase RelE/StbE
VSYDVFITRKVEKALTRLPKDTYARMTAAIDALADDPRPSRCKKLSGREGYHIWVGRDYRVLYHVDDGEQRVEVFWVGTKQDAY